jgi:hypothetical protein
MDGKDKARNASDNATTRSPADREIFGDKDAAVPVKDRPPEEKEKFRDSTEAGGVD